MRSGARGAHAWIKSHFEGVIALSTRLYVQNMGLGMVMLQCDHVQTPATVCLQSLVGKTSVELAFPN